MKRLGRPAEERLAGLRSWRAPPDGRSRQDFLLGTVGGWNQGTTNSDPPDG